MRNVIGRLSGASSLNLLTFLTGKPSKLCTFWGDFTFGDKLEVFDDLTLKHSLTEQADGPCSKSMGCETLFLLPLDSNRVINSFIAGRLARIEETSKSASMAFFESCLIWIFVDSEHFSDDA